MSADQDVDEIDAYQEQENNAKRKHAVLLRTVLSDAITLSDCAVAVGRKTLLMRQPHIPHFPVSDDTFSVSLQFFF